MIQPFSIARLPRIEFGAGYISKLPNLIAQYGNRVLLVTGQRSFPNSPHWPTLLAALDKAGIGWEHTRVGDEPSPQGVDKAVRQFHGRDIAAVAGIGGGSVLDAAKAIAGLLPSGDSAMDYLEGVGPEKPYHGPAAPFIAVPTTAGTGSEATKNAVLSMRGPAGFKKSFRHDLLVPEYALLDPDLLASCPPPQIAANAMDALTQLLESYVSTKANPFTDALAESGLNAARKGLFAWYEGREEAAAGRERMAYAALLSGVCLAQTGLGSVHGLASPLGAFFPIPHGVVCGALVGAATRVNLAALRERDPKNPAWRKYARAAEILHGRHYPDPEAAHAALLTLLDDWTERLALPRLSAYGIQHRDFAHVVAHARGGSMKTNPLVLSDAEIADVLRQRL
ncbi:MAG: iron-containing alcohol dehydrogenase [Candidatus Competibacter sp.]|nr:iron-containing alcohol dehydrogenase [Candidatus Competibacter sp.]MDG4606613.1 iron-containing alcohol dehydrogenase [Candidatus Contendobacter sp.]HRD50071.1 iron-containing alcohol dehydrogenase [Candidatus Contendobacter sp.]